MPVYFVVFTGGRLYILDLAAKIDQCAEYLCKSLWGDLEFPPPFGRDALPEVSDRCMAFTSIKCTSENYSFHYKMLPFCCLSMNRCKVIMELEINIKILKKKNFFRKRTLLN